MFSCSMIAFLGAFITYIFIPSYYSYMLVQEGTTGWMEVDRYPSNHASIHPYIHTTSIIYPSIIYALIHPSMHLSIHTSIHLSIYPFFHPFIHPSIYPFIYPSIYPFIYSFIYPSIHPSIHPFMLSLRAHITGEYIALDHRCLLPTVEVELLIGTSYVSH